jgi:tRNA (adenine22-N1)-methyltransferase
MKKLSKRLQAINNMIDTHYQNIWDCCCDHGLLGLTLLNRKTADIIHFVDIVPSLTTRLESLLEKYFVAEGYTHCWQVHCIDVAKLPLTTNEKHLIIIAGVGGELLIEFMESIISKYQQNLSVSTTVEVEFILCPVHYNYHVRQTLIKHNCSLLAECIINENKRFYEVIHVKKTFTHSTVKHTPLCNVSPTGSLMWDMTNKIHQEYLEKTLNHYQRALFAETKKEQVSTHHIIEQYAALLPRDKPSD